MDGDFRAEKERDELSRGIRLAMELNPFLILLIDNSNQFGRPFTSIKSIISVR